MSAARPAGADAQMPEPLPTGERVLWQGAPDWRLLAVRALHVRSLAIYFAILLAWSLLSALTSGTPPMEALVSTGRLAGLALVALVLLTGYAWLAARATTYTVTTRRVVMRMGLAVPMTINLPFTRIDAAGADLRRDGSGDIALRLSEGGKLGYVVLWPHARRWRMARPEPTLRAVPDAARVAQILARGLAASASVPVQPLPVAVQLGPVLAGTSHAAA